MAWTWTQPYGVWFSYKPHEESLRGDPSLGLICNHDSCRYEGEAAPDSDEVHRQAKKRWVIGFMLVWIIPVFLAVIFGLVFAGVYLERWRFVLVAVGAIAFIVFLVYGGLRWGYDFSLRTRVTYICPVCRNSSLIPLNSPRGQRLQARNQQDTAEQLPEQMPEG